LLDGCNKFRGVLPFLYVNSNYLVSEDKSSELCIYQACLQQLCYQTTIKN